MPLTNAAAKAAGARDRAYKLHDQGGLHLLVRPTGSKTWQQKYRWRGREKLLTIGAFPAVRVERARILQAEAKDALSRGTDPAYVSTKSDSSNTLEQLARAWYRHNLTSWSPAHAADVIGSLERNVFSELGNLAPGAIDPPALLNALRSVEKRGCVASAQRLRQRLSEIFRYGKAEGLCSSDPAEALGAAMREAPPATPHPALTSIEDCRALLAACDPSSGSGVAARPMTRLASRFLALTAVRLDSVRGMRWGELALRPSTGSGPQGGRLVPMCNLKCNFAQLSDSSEVTWHVPAARLKLKRSKKDVALRQAQGEREYEHLVPLSAAAIAVLREAAHHNAPCRTNLHRSDAQCTTMTQVESSALVFPGRLAGQPIGEGSIGELYDRALRPSTSSGPQDERLIGKRHVPHGWRSSFSTILNEQLGEEWAMTIDAALGHSKSDKVEAAYNRSVRLERRRELFDRWGENLCGLPPAAT